MTSQLKLLPLRVVAEVTGISLHTLRRWASQHRIPVVKMSNRVLVAEKDLAQLIEERSVPARREVAV